MNPGLTSVNGRCGERAEGERKRRALSGLALDLDAAVMPIDNPLRQAQAQADAFDAGDLAGSARKKRSKMWDCTPGSMPTPVS